MNKNIFNMLKETIQQSYSPYSHYRVSAVVEAEDGSLYTGANIENASYSLTICAERAAIFKAIIDGKNVVSHVYIYSENSIIPYPCGACLQVITEFAQEQTLITVCNDEIEETYTLKDLLPKNFAL